MPSSPRSSVAHPAFGQPRLLASIACALLLGAAPALSAQQPDNRQSVSELKKLSVEELMALHVTSVSRAEERLGNAPAAVSVVTSEDIRRSGVTTVPGALRLMPGLHVAQQTSSQWVVAARGFSSAISEKLLVLSDTRSLYTPLFSGVLWDVQNYLLQDIDRIEVIRGPGATLWGSNAVNGVINITTKRAQDTQGLYFEVNTGAEEHAGVGIRYGGQLHTNAAYRIYGRFFDRDATFTPDPARLDDWRAGHAGFRVDWDVTARDAVTIQGDGYLGRVGQLAPSAVVIGRPGPEGLLEVDVGGGNVLARWKRTLSNQSDVQLRVYYDHTHRNDPMFVDDLDTFDVDLQHRFSPYSRHELTWGASYRVTAHTNQERILFKLTPPESTDHLVSGFIQDHIALRESLRLTVGTKLEHNQFSGTEWQPSARIAWAPPGPHAVWSAVSRAVRVPTRFERDIDIDISDPTAPMVARLLGNRDFGAERLVAFEAGYRWQPVGALSTDIAAFHNRYRGLASLEFGDPFQESPERVVIPVHNENLTTGHTQGLEALVTYAPMATMRWTLGYSLLDMDLRAHGEDLNRGERAETASPRHQLGLRASFDLPSKFQVDGQFRHLSELRELPTSLGESVPAYSELSARVAWLGWKDAELALIGRHLLHDRHREFGPTTSTGQIERAVYMRLAWGF